MSKRIWRLVLLQLGNHLVALLHPGDSVVDKLVNDGLGRLLLVDNGGALAHEEGAVLVEDILVIVVVVVVTCLHNLVEIGLVGDGTLGGELLHLGLAVDLPVVDVLIVADTHGAAGEDDSLDIVVVAGSLDGLLVSFGGTGLVSEDEAGADPDGTSTHHEGGSEQLAIVDAASGDDLNGLASQRGLVLLADLNDGGDKDSRGNVSGVATALTALGANDVDAKLNALLDMLDVADHVHVDDAMFVKLVDNGLWGDADGRDEDSGLLLDNNVDEFIELALCVVVTIGERISRQWS